MTFVVPYFLCDFLWVSYWCRRQKKGREEKEKEILPGLEEASKVKERHVKERVYVRDTHTKKKYIKYYMSKTHPFGFNSKYTVCVAQLYTCPLYWKFHWQLNVGNNTARDQILCFQFFLYFSCSLSHFLSFSLLHSYIHRYLHIHREGTGNGLTPLKYSLTDTIPKRLSSNKLSPCPLAHPWNSRAPK